MDMVTWLHGLFLIRTRPSFANACFTIHYQFGLSIDSTTGASCRFKLGKKNKINLCWTILEYNTFVLFTKFFDVLVALPVLCPRLWSCSWEWSVPDNFLAEKPA
jgi:hypothetical protein